MIKKVLTTCLGIASILLGTVVASPLKATAGQAVIEGSTPDSSGTSGDSFSSVSIITIITSVIEGINVSAGSSAGSVILQVTQVIQIALNQVANRLFSLTTTISTTVVALFTGGNTPQTTAIVNQSITTFTSYGVSQSRASRLFLAISRMISVQVSATPATPVAQVTPNATGIAVKGLKADTMIAQSNQQFSVDINQLNEAIEAYNDIVNESDLDTLRKLSQDKTFREIGQVLK
jgi:hypothetical protein